uniref:Uncharacterized protein n=1 Tax=Otus sunia TaxID=257818 RepID=A0A8C8EEV4_9STRI
AGPQAAELQLSLAELRARRAELSGRIRAEEAERGRLQARIAALSERLARTSESLAGHLVARGELDRTIADTEAAYGKVPRPRRSLSPLHDNTIKKVEMLDQQRSGKEGNGARAGTVTPVTGMAQPFPINSARQGLLHSVCRVTAEFTFELHTHQLCKK